MRLRGDSIRFFGAMALALAVVLPCTAGDPPGQGTVPAPAVTVRVYDFAGVRQRELARAEGEVERILRRSGVEIRWIDCPVSRTEPLREPDCQLPLGPTDLVLRILPEPMAVRIVPVSKKLGLAAVSTDRRTSYNGNFFYVFYDRVRILARRSAASRDLILGCVMAHEMGHLLLGSLAHSRRGVLRAKWRPRDLQLAAQGLLKFSPEQANQLRGAVLARSGLYENPSLVAAKVEKKVIGNIP